MHTDLQSAETSGLPLSPVTKQAFRLIAIGSKAHPPIGSVSQAARLDRLTAAKAWTDAALALVELELPHWHVRRLEYDGGQWHCLLSLYPSMPREVDDAVDGRDALLPLAILDALIEARRRAEGGTRRSTREWPLLARSEAVWCENTF